MANEDTIDFDLIQRDDGFFDIQIEDGQFVTENAFDTAILMSLFEERRADESQQPVNFLRRGWWGNELADVEDFEIGSLLWLLYQARSTNDTVNNAVSFTNESLQWMIEDNFLSNIEVTGSRDESKVTVNIDFIRRNDVVDSKGFTLWNNTLKLI